MDWSTLLGVVVGGALSLATAYLLERRRDNAAAKREGERASEDLRTAARLIRNELYDAETEVLGALHAGRYPVQRSLSLEHWHEYSAILARHLPAPDWSLVTVGVNRVKEMNADREYSRRHEATEQDLANLEDHEKELESAVEVLWRLTGDREALRAARREAWGPVPPSDEEVDGRASESQG